MGNYFSSIEYRQKKLAEAKEYVRAQGYTPHFDEWIGFRAKYEVECDKGHRFFVAWSEFFSRDTRCKKCHYESLTVKNPKFKGMSRVEWRQLREQEFKEALTAEGYTWDDAEFKYINNITSIPVTCPRGHAYNVNWNGWFDLKNRCYDCWIEDSRLTQEQVMERLTSKGCELLSTYEGVDKPFKYRCECGNISRIRLRDFDAGVRCSRCGGEKARITLRKTRQEKLKNYSQIYLKQDS